jgi:hypothetical protein
MDAIYGCDGCRTTIGRAGCPTHRDSAVYTDRHEWSTSEPVLTHCIHGLDLRLHPRCYLCRPASDEQVTSKCDHAALVEAARALLDHELDERGQVLEVEDNTLHLALRAALIEEARNG